MHKVKLIELKGEIKSNATTIKDFNTLLSTMDRSSTETTGIVDLNNTIDQKVLTNIYRTFYPTSAEYKFFSSAHRIFSRIDHMSGHRTSVSKFKIERISTIFSDHNGVKLEMNNRNKTGKFMNTGKLNNSLLINQWIK